MKLLFIVNESPWGSVIALSAWRLVRAAAESGSVQCAVFFREDGIYNALGGADTDAGTVNLAQQWAELATRHGVRLMLCRSSVQRRLQVPLTAPFESSGLAEMAEHMITSDRVLTF